MGVARLSKVTIISPRSEYDQVAKALAQFEDFHPLEGTASNFDPVVQDLAVKAVRLFAEGDQAAKDLDLKLMPGQIDTVFRGVKIPQSEFEAGTWRDLLGKAEAQLWPVVQEVRLEKVALQKALKEEADASTMMAALEVVSGMSTEIGGIQDLHLLKTTLVIVPTQTLGEFRNSIPDAIFVTQPISSDQTMVLAAVKKDDETKLDRAMKLLELKPLVIPSALPQNPAEAFRKLTEDRDSAAAARMKIEEQMAKTRQQHGAELLAVRELAEAARKMLDEVRISGGMKRLATISGYVPAKKGEEMKRMFGKWMVHTESVGAHGEEHVPTLLTRTPGLGLYQPITREQGIPGGVEIDPTPIVSLIFPIFFGMMFADVGHGIILCLFMLLVRQRATGSMRQWANLFLVAGVSSIVFGVIFGEFFELSLYNFVPIPPVVEVIRRAAGSPDSFNIAGVYLVMEVAILIGVAHLVTGISLDIYQGIKEGDRLELVLEKIPVLTMYVSGVGYGLAFIGAGFSFNVLQSSAPAPLVGIPNNLLGVISLVVLLPSMLWLLGGRAIAIGLGKIKDGGSAVGALANGGLEVFERISQFLSNTISYVRLAVLLLVHAGLLLITNQYFGPSGILAPWPELLPIWIILNMMILAFEVFIVYVQDLRLHLYEFFTKFFLGTGTPFRKILPDRARVRIKWV